MDYCIEMMKISLSWYTEKLLIQIYTLIGMLLLIKHVKKNLKGQNEKTNYI